MAALSMALSWRLSPEKERPTKVAPSSMARPQVSIGGRSLSTPDFSFEPRSAVAENWPLVRPLTPRAIRLRFASIAPVATEGMRPCTELKLWERFMKYAGLFEEQPMPLNFATRSGCTPISYMASMMRSEIALWPQPAHRVVL